MAFELETPCPLPPADVRARLGALGEYLSNKYGLTVAWTNDTEAKISGGKYLVVEIDGTLSILQGTVRFTGKDPGMLWRGKAKDYLGKKLAKYLSPATPVDALPKK